MVPTAPPPLRFSTVRANAHFLQRNADAFQVRMQPVHHAHGVSNQLRMSLLILIRHFANGKDACGSLQGLGSSFVAKFNCGLVDVKESYSLLT